MLDKVEALIEKLNSEGAQFSIGQYAIVCTDGVVIMDISEDGYGITVINNRLDVDHVLGITNEEVEAFLALEEVVENGGE